MVQSTVSDNWYAPWQRRDHAVRFDFRADLDGRNLVRLYETMNDIRLLKERFGNGPPITFLEVGCATGDLYRYLKLAFPHFSYWGMDVSRPAIQRAKAKYPEGRFLVSDPAGKLADLWEKDSNGAQAQVVYSADVLHHQTDPFGFLGELIHLASSAVIVRCRTRDVGRTEWDPARSRQRHYNGWVPYIVLNLEELLGWLRGQVPESEILIYRSHVVLGGRYGRELPPECSLPETATAETAVGIFRRAGSPGRVTLLDRPDNQPNTTLDYKLRSLLRRLKGDVPLAHVE